MKALLRASSRRRWELARTLGLVSVCALGPGCEPDERAGSSRLTVFDGLTGEPLWNIVVRSGEPEIALFAPDGEIAVYEHNQCMSDRARAFTARTGKPLDEPPDEGFPIPADQDSMGRCGTLNASNLGFGNGACFRQEGGELVAQDATTGAERFRVPSQSDWLRFVDDHLFGISGISRQAMGRGTIQLLSPDDGSLLWEVEAEDQTPQYAGKTVVYLEGTDGTFSALALADGEELWRQQLECDRVTASGDFLVCVDQLRASYCKYPD